ncbi:hypothetical protein [Lactiplantibacillus plantarum]|uniref:hypothetical protein n=1 Tax=Lactiplantibacillus plantarum TaxID=1590 RepID=UPI003F529235
MAVKLTTITHGQGGWDDAENANFKALKDGIDGKITSEGWITDPLVMLNGFTVFSDSQMDIPAYKVISQDGEPVRFILKGSILPPSTATGKTATVMSIPGSLINFISAAGIQSNWFVGSVSFNNVLAHINWDNKAIELASSVPINTLGRIQLDNVFSN